MTRSTMVGPADGEIPQRVRRPLAILSIVGYPLAVLMWTAIGPALGLHQAIAAVVGLTVLAATLFAGYHLYRFRSKMAQAPDDRLDERQRQIRDRAYVDSYRWFVLLTLVVLIAAGILPDLLDRPIELTYEVVNWFVMGAILISIALPSAVVAWREPDLAD